jgi:subtilisin family serine protease
VGKATIVINLFAILISAQPDAPKLIAPFAADLEKGPQQSHRVWVFFTDKQMTTRAALDAGLESRRAELSPRAIHRRLLRRSSPGLLDLRDLAVSADYIRAVTATGASLRRESRWLNAISIQATGVQIKAIEHLPFVRLIQPLARSVVRPPMPVTEIVADPRAQNPSWYGNSYLQLNQVNIYAAHNAGFTGAGVVIGVLDTGFVRTHNVFNQTTNGAHPVQVLGEHDFINNDGDTTQQGGDPPGQSDHGTYILGTLAAYQPNFLVGAAFDASFYLAKTEDISQEVPAEEDNYVAGLEWIESNGADMATSSLSYIDWYTQSQLDGQTAVTTIAVNIATDNGLVCCTAAGNGGHDSSPTNSHLGAPADAFRVITCGAIDSSGVIAFFSSDGPSADGRPKPELLARGVQTNTVSPSSNSTIVGVDGTSLSTPIVAGGVALIIQAHPDWSVDKIRRALFHTASRFQAFAAFDPQHVLGYGTMNILAAIQFVHSDIDNNGTADGRDIRLFTQSLIDDSVPSAQRRRSDVNASGFVDMNDVPIFVNDILGL